MAIFKIFPSKDATIRSEFPSKNEGLDEILEINSYRDLSGTAQVSRALLQFSTEEINDLITNKISGSQFDVYLKLYLANAEELPVEYSLYCYPISQSWDMGTGRYSNSPETRNGVCWVSSSISTRWSSSGGDFYSTPVASQSFAYNDSKDIEFKVTNTINLITSSIPNYGFIIKHSDSLEFITGSQLILKYFSRDTHTIYPPCLEFRWNDFSYSTGSLSTVTSDEIVATLANNKGEFQQDSIQKFRINVRDKYPTRIFQTSSIYTVNKLLPTASYWAIKDLDTEETVINFDETYTKLSCDSQGNYFSLYMNGLEVERYYKILIKTTINNSTLVLDNNYYFKVVR
ncbi:MAG TPA: hypothetical protein VFV86_08425 [Nitrososphaeraceae archaeon]|nr:hypothetical protein [Nitrososphaeraceae archaeon]